MLLAMGFVHPVHEGMLEELGVALDPRGNVAADTDDYRTSLPTRSSPAGDMRRGQSLVVWAIREGRQAAHAVDEFLMGATCCRGKTLSLRALGSNLPRHTVARADLVRPLLKDFHFHLGDAPFGHFQLLCGRIRDIKCSSFYKGTPVVHPDNH